LHSVTLRIGGRDEEDVFSFPQRERKVESHFLLGCLPLLLPGDLRAVEGDGDPGHPLAAGDLASDHDPLGGYMRLVYRLLQGHLERC
jgi:hypothetical protein